MSVPPPPPPPSQPPMSAAASGAAPQNGMGTAALVRGILQFFCLSILGAILAIVFGRIGMKRAEQGLATNGGAAKAGYILGIIGVVIWIIGFIFYLVAVANGSK